jgi:2-oxoisovalerate dehydrogenase E1 component alpha subunit
MPDPEPAAMFENVYAGPHALIDAEREQFAAYLDSFVTQEAPR